MPRSLWKFFKAEAATPMASRRWCLRGTFSRCFAMFTSAAMAAHCRDFWPGKRSIAETSASTAPAASAARALAAVSVMCQSAWQARHCNRAAEQWWRMAAITTARPSPEASPTHAKLAGPASRWSGLEAALAKTWHTVSCARRSSGCLRASSSAFERSAAARSLGRSHSYQSPWPSVGTARVRETKAEMLFSSAWSFRTAASAAFSLASTARNTQPWSITRVTVSSVMGRPPSPHSFWR
mmetsp:Transcript_22472/g.71224  ORF Transcript_22472/g.71224 Transcript_22472/m.71224 type:complete len:239 (-) Transcript_22472:250-966(-)